MIRAFQNDERKFYQQLGGDDTKTYQQPDARETERFWTKIWQPKKHNQKSELITKWLKNQKGSKKAKSGNTHRFNLNNTEKISNWKMPGHDGIRGFWFKEFTSIHDRLALKWTDAYKEHKYPHGWPKERPKQRNHSKQLQTHNLPTDDVENVRSTN